MAQLSKNTLSIFWVAGDYVNFDSNYRSLPMKLESTFSSKTYPCDLHFFDRRTFCLLLILFRKIQLLTFKKTLEKRNSSIDITPQCIIWSKLSYDRSLSFTLNLRIRLSKRPLLRRRFLYPGCLTDVNGTGCEMEVKKKTYENARRNNH